jgi:hypothetical protein
MPNPNFAVLLQEDEYKTYVIPKSTFKLIPMNQNRPLNEGFMQILAGPPLTCLFIVAHGLEGKVEAGKSTQYVAGLGIALGFEGIFNNNVGIWQKIKGQVQNIVVYSCNAATTDGKLLRGSVADGKYMMGALAMYSGANVYAADRMQSADIGNNVDFGPWEGQVWEFSPSGQPPRAVDKPPYELSDL